MPCRYTLSNLRKDQNGASLAMYPSVVSAFQAQGYVSKGRRFLSDAPFGRFSKSLARRLPLEVAHAFGAYCRSALSELGKVWAGFLLAGTFGAGIWPSGLDLGPPKLESCLRWPPAIKSELLLLPGVLFALLYSGGPSAYQPLYPFRPSSHKYGFLLRAVALPTRKFCKTKANGTRTNTRMNE